MKLRNLTVVIAIALLCSGALAQNPTQPQPREVTTTTVTMLNPPIAPSGITVGFTGAPGSSAKTLYYWLVSNFTVGNSTISPVAPGFNAPTTLTSSNFFTVYWQSVAGANSYDLLRTSTPTPPTGACACAVATGITGTSQVDQSNSLSAYTVNTFNANSALLQLSAEAVGAGAGNVHYLLKQNGALVQDLSAPLAGSAAFSTITPGTNNGALFIGAGGSLGVTGGGLINSTTLLNGSWLAPGACIGCTTPNPGQFTNLQSTWSLSNLGTAQSGGNISITGWGSGAAVSAVSGYGQRATFTITAGTAPLALNPTIALTFPTAAPAAPICTPRQDDGGTGIVAELSIGTPSTTGCGTVTWLQTPVSGATYIFTMDARL